MGCYAVKFVSYGRLWPVWAVDGLPASGDPRVLPAGVCSCNWGYPREKVPPCGGSFGAVLTVFFLSLFLLAALRWQEAPALMEKTGEFPMKPRSNNNNQLQHPSHNFLRAPPSQGCAVWVRCQRACMLLTWQSPFPSSVSLC